MKTISNKCSVLFVSSCGIVCLKAKCLNGSGAHKSQTPLRQPAQLRTSFEAGTIYRGVVVHSPGFLEYLCVPDHPTFHPSYSLQPLF